MFPGVIPGSYRILVEAAGMQKFEGALTVQVQQSAVVDVTMKIGQATTEIQVQDVTPMLQVDNPTLGHVLERTRIEQLPINGRQVTSLLQTVPGMEGTRAYGLRDYSFEAVLDGSALADRYGWNPITYRQPGLDSIQEFKVENNSSSAKFSRPTSIVMSTKSGTNQLHGSAFETNRNNAVGLARSRTDYYTKPPYLNRNEFGASAGGPVYLPKVYNGKDKTFWFFSYEALRNINARTVGAVMPTQAMRNGDMSGLVNSMGQQYKIYDPWTTDPVTWSRQQFAYNGQLNVIDPKLLNPLSKLLYSVSQLPTLQNVNPLVANNWYGPVSLPTRSWTISTRIDHRFTEKDQFYGRYTQGNYTSMSQLYSYLIPTLDPKTVPANSNTNRAPNKSIALSYVRSFSPTFFNELLVSGARQPFYVGTGDPTVDYDAIYGLPNPFNAKGMPGLYNGGLLNDYYQFETQNATGFAAFYAILDDNATKIYGKHEFQFGYHFRYDQMNLLAQQQLVAGSDNWATGGTALYDPSTSRTNPQAMAFTGNNQANMFLGLMQYSNHFVRGMFYARAKEDALYFQDNWRLTPRLTLNLGLRWDYWPAFTEKNNVVTGFDRTQKAVVLGRDLNTMFALRTTLPSIVNRFTELGVKFESYKEAGLPSNLTESSLKNFGPRLGFAYRAGEGAKSFVLRGGYRIAYFHIPLGPWAARMRMNAPMDAWFYNSLTQAAYSPDGIANYGMRSVPTLLSGVNSRNAVTTDAAKGLAPGSPFMSYFAREVPDARVQDWNLTLEKEVMENTVIRAGYVGNHSSHLELFYRYNESTPPYIWYVTTGQPLPTGTYANVARRFFDQKTYGTLEEYKPIGFGNSNGFQLELERRYSKGYGFQVFYVMDNNLAAGGLGYNGIIPEVNQYLPGQIPLDLDARNRFLNYRRDTSVPKHRVRWNWLVDLPFGKGKPLMGNAGAVLNRIVGGWQIAGMGSLRSTYFSLPTSLFPNGNAIEIYGYKYPIQDCTSGTCYPGYLWWNGYIPANQINSYDPVTGKPNGYMGVPPTYKPSVQPIWPYPANYASLNSTIDPLYPWYGTNTLWIPLQNGTVQRQAWSGLEALRNQYLPSVRQWSVDASLFKAIPITERFSLRFNADFFNVLNHPGNPNSVGSTGVLSTQSSGNDPRTLQLTLRLSW